MAIRDAAQAAVDQVVSHRIDAWSRRLDTSEGTVAALRSACAVLPVLVPRDISRQVVRIARLLGMPFQAVTAAGC